MIRTIDERRTEGDEERSLSAAAQQLLQATTADQQLRKQILFDRIAKGWKKDMEKTHQLLSC